MLEYAHGSQKKEKSKHYNPSSSRRTAKGEKTVERFHDVNHRSQRVPHHEWSSGPLPFQSFRRQGGFQAPNGHQLCCLWLPRSGQRRLPPLQFVRGWVADQGDAEEGIN